MERRLIEIDQIKKSIYQLENWVVRHQYQAYEPFDGLNSWLGFLGKGKYIRQGIIQFVLRCPMNLRPILGIKPTTSTKAMGYFARGYLKLYQITGQKAWLNKAYNCLEWLKMHSSPNYPGISWGNHFDYQSRGYYLPKGGPTVVWTSLIGHAYMDAFELLNRDADLEIAIKATKFILEGLERKKETKGICISYVPGTYLPIHNANMLAGGFLARVYKYTRDENLYQVAKEAVEYTVNAQHPEGFWWYGEHPKYHWVDNWHTAYVLDSLWWYMKSTEDFTYMGNFRKGVQFWLDHFFVETGIPKFYSNKIYPIDIQCASQAIESLTLYAQVYDPLCLPLAEKVALWTISNMQDKEGYFYFRRYWWGVNKIPMLHWGQATMFHALCILLKEMILRENHETKPRVNSSG